MQSNWEQGHLSLGRELGEEAGEGREDEGGWVRGTQRQERWGEEGLQARDGGGSRPHLPGLPPMTPQEREAGRPVPAPISVGREDNSPCGLEEETPTGPAPSWGPSPLRSHHPGGWKQGHSPSGTGHLRSTAPPSPGGPRGRPRSLLRSWALLPGPHWLHSLGSPTVCIVKPTSDRGIPGLQRCN